MVDSDTNRNPGPDAAPGTVDPLVAAEARRAALRGYDRTHRHRLNLALGAAVAVIALGDLAYILLANNSRATATPPDTTASISPPTPIEMAAAEPAPASPAPVEMTAAKPAPTPPAPSPAVSPPASPPASSPQIPEAVREKDAKPEPAPIHAAAPDPAGLRRNEVQEVQARLRSFGFNPGPVDGSAGPMTEAAVLRYQQNRAQIQTGKVDRQLLEALRQEPTAKVARRGAPSAPDASRPPARSNDPLAVVRTASARLSQWFQSLGR